MKTSWYNNKWVIVILHIAAWLLLFSLPVLLSSSHNNNAPHFSETKETWSTILEWAMNLSWVAFFYLNAFVLIPRFIYTNRYQDFISLQGLVYIFLTWESYFFFKVLSGRPHFEVDRHVLFNFFIFLFFLSFSTAFTMIRDKIKTDQINAKRENENLKTELTLLRSQASPHFMFNVLNNMVALARKKSDLLEPSLIKLSSLMRYMLYDSDDTKVSLENEIDYIQSYIDLQQQRFGNRLKLNVAFHPSNDQYQIEPMLLIPLVENAFKHGTGNIEDASIDIRLTAENGMLDFCVKNKFNPASTDEKDNTHGIGLPNLKRRLDLLYGKNHKLLISEKDDLFTVSLQIQIS